MIKHVVQKEMHSNRLPDFSTVHALLDLHLKKPKDDGSENLENVLPLTYDIILSLIPRPRDPSRQQYERRIRGDASLPSDEEAAEMACLLDMTPEDCQIFGKKIKEVIKQMQEVSQFFGLMVTFFQ